MHWAGASDSGSDGYWSGLHAIHVVFWWGGADKPADGQSSHQPSATHLGICEVVSVGRLSGPRWRSIGHAHQSGQSTDHDARSEPYGERFLRCDRSDWGVLCLLYTSDAADDLLC